MPLDSSTLTPDKEPNGYVRCAFERKLRELWLKNPLLVVVLFEEMGMVDVAARLRKAIP